MTILLNREFHHEVDTISGSHQNLSFSVIGLPSGDLEIQFSGDKAFALKVVDKCIVQVQLVGNHG